MGFLDALSVELAPFTEPRIHYGAHVPSAFRQERRSESAVEPQSSRNL